MAFKKEKGLVALATAYINGEYVYTKIDTFVAKDSLSITPDQMLDLDSTRNAKGKLKRHVLEHTASKIEFTTPYQDEDKLQRLMNILRKGFALKDGETVENERKARIRYYDEYIDDYKTGYFYNPNTTFNYATTFNGKRYVNGTRFELIEY